MAETEVVRVGKLYFTFEGYERLPDSNEAGVDELEVRVSVENTDRPLGEAGRPPLVELHDSEGGIYEPVNLDHTWYDPALPATTAEAHLRFRLPESATGLTLVLAPGEDEEVEVDLEPVLGL